MQTPHPWIPGLLCLLVFACGGAPANAPKALPPPPSGSPAAPAPTPAPPPQSDSPGRLDAELVRAAASARGVEKIKLEAEADGAIRYFSVHHQDVDAIPEPVRAHLKEPPGAKVARYESEFVAGAGRLFEVEFVKEDQQACEFSARADGSLLYNECHIDRAALPEPVRAAFDRAYPGAALKEVEKKRFADGGDEYELEFELDGRMHELYYKPDGALIRHMLVIPAVIEVPVP